MAHIPLRIEGRMVRRLARHIDDLLDDKTGCPWDRAQTPASLARLLIGEAEELQEAIRRPDDAAEEAGDCLMLLFMILAKLQDRRGTDPNLAFDSICRKIVRRHTWIYGGESAPTPAAAMRLWKRNKRRERSGSSRAAKKSAAVRDRRSGA
ncbi:MAG: hypothetical protein N3A38_13810 [Planctomycetota bacterium]|nr:hypothetical protein [Planctomycetota bacterium]